MGENVQMNVFGIKEMNGKGLMGASCATTDLVVGVISYDITYIGLVDIVTYNRPNRQTCFKIRIFDSPNGFSSFGPSDAK